MTTTTPLKPLLKPSTLAYATLLQRAGFTIYVPNPAIDHSTQVPQGWFHYSRDLYNGTFYGTAYIENTFGSSLYYEPCHLMPIKPSREFGSAITVGRRSNGLDRPQTVWSVEAAEYTAQPQNTAEYIPGVSFHNHKPWGVSRDSGGVYIPMEPMHRAFGIAAPSPVIVGIETEEGGL